MDNIFLLWLDHFIKHVKPTENEKILPILDNHSSHCPIGAIEQIRENNIVVLSLPPHISHKMQPLDKTFSLPSKRLMRSNVNGLCYTIQPKELHNMMLGQYFA